MRIHISSHTLKRARERGTNEQKIREVISTGFPIPARHNREGRAKVYDLRENRLGKYYEQKRVEVFYATEQDVIVTVTVYVFFGKWEDKDADLL